MLASAGLCLVSSTGCGLGGSVLPSPGFVETIRGKDSAGATIELEKRDAAFTAARVIDVVLGTGEAEVATGNDGHIEFTISFPAGVEITYRGQQFDVGAIKDTILSGTWHQHAHGYFAADMGTWSVPDVDTAR